MTSESPDTKHQRPLLWPVLSLAQMHSSVRGPRINVEYVDSERGVGWWQFIPYSLTCSQISAAVSTDHKFIYGGVRALKAQLMQPAFGAPT